MNPIGDIPSSGCAVRRLPGSVITTTCSVIPKARRIIPPKIHNVCESLGLATIIANTTTTMERPIKTPATKLTASRNA